jgi:hypothetical protein
MVQHVVHYFTVRTELSFERNNSFNLGASRGRYALFASNRPIELSWRNTCNSIRTTICVRSRSIYHIVSLWEWNSFVKGICPANHSFLLENGNGCSNRPNSAKLKKHKSHSKEHNLCYKLQNLVHCFPVKNEFVFERNISWKVCFWKWWWTLFDPKRPVQLSWRNTSICPRQPSVVKAGSSRTVFSCENSGSFGKEYCLKITVLKVEIGSVCSKEECSAELKKHMYPSKENHLCWKLQHVAHCFSVRTALLFERNSSYKS